VARPDDLLLVSRQPCRSSKRLPFGLGPVDLTGAAGRVTMGVLSAVAEFEKDLVVERTMAGVKRPEAVELAHNENVTVLQPVEKPSKPFL
jgi:DNA invertase Pin-like site-specific DNA recombinase